MGNRKSIDGDTGARSGDLSACLGLGLLTLVFFYKIVLTNLILTGVDVFTYFYPYRDYAAEAVRQVRLPLWNPYLFLGVPFLANSQAATFYPLHWPLAWLPVSKQVAFSIALHVFLGGVFAYFYARRSVGVSRFSAFLGAVVFAFSGFVGAQVEHVNQLNVVVWLPLLLLLWDGMEGRKLNRSSVLLAGLVVGLMFLAGHTQATYICLFGWGAYAVVEKKEQERLARQGLEHECSAGRASSGTGRGPFKSWSWGRDLVRRMALCVLIVAIGASIAAIQLLPTLELSRWSNRAGGLSYQEASSFSLRPQLLAWTLLPTFGENLAQVFGGEAFSEYIAYLGVLGLFLALVGALLGVGRRHRGALIFLAGLGFFLAAGRANPLYYLLYKVVPGISLFRAPARWMLLYTFGGAMLAAVGADMLVAPLDVKAQLARRSHARFARWAWRRLLIGGGLVALLMILLSPWLDFPTWPTLAAWAALGLAALVFWVSGLASQRRSGRAAHWAWKVALAGLLLVELFAASRGLAYNRATAPEALSSLRTAPAHLLADARFGGRTPPPRFLSLSDIRYDPGDQADIQVLLADQLPPEAIYDFIVAAKRKEILAPNLSLYYRLPAVDGYDGGLLPLKRYVTFQRLFFENQVPWPDGRLREQLHQVPEGRLLSMLNVKYVITDKVYDVWIDDVFYDLEHRAVLGVGAAEQVELMDLPAFDATTLGVVSYLEGGETITDGEPVAEVTVVDETGQTRRYLLRAGIETAEGEYAARQPRHALARAGHHWRDNPAGNDYIAHLALGVVNGQATALQSITVRYLVTTGRLDLRGLTLIDERTGTFYPLTISTSGRFQLVHSGDVKVYENLDVLPRAYVVHQARIVTGDEAALALLQGPAFDPAVSVVLADETSPPQLLPDTRATGDEKVSIVQYEAERVRVEANLVQEGYLVLSDTYYPGWHVRVDGEPDHIHRANLLFRAVYLPAGHHIIEFQFRPMSVYVGAIISAIVALLIVLSLFVFSRRRSHNR